MALVANLVSTPGVKVGDLRWYCGLINVSGEQVVRFGWLAANQALVSRTTYSKLFTECGFAYSPTPGVDPGSNNFYLPLCTDGRNPVGKGASFPTRGGIGGEHVHTLNATEEPNHAHTYFDRYAPRSGSGSPSYPSVGTFQAPYGGDALQGTIGANGAGGQAHQNMPPVQVVGGMLIRYA